jgi:predicted dehydrogenase
MNSASGVKLYAMGDMFRDHLESAKANLQKRGNDKFDVSSDRCFIGFDAYKQVIDSGVDLVILATPPGFRPMHLAAAIAAGKHVFTEKPVGVDGPGIRRVLEAAGEAKQKNLAVVAGTQRRHQAGYIESMKRIHDGELGELTSARCYWNQGSLWMKPRESGWSDMEWQLRNWLYFTWLSGDHICEQHVHNIDVVNWAMKGHPKSAMGMGGRQVRTSPDYGHIFDHFAIDFEYENGAHCMSMCRQIPGCENNVSEALVGTKGSWDGKPNTYVFETGGKRSRLRVKEINPYDQEHIDLIESIRAGKPLNELTTVAESTLTAIMGRMSTYTGKAVTWEQALNSKENLVPQELKLGPLATPAVAVPGQTELI